MCGICGFAHTDRQRPADRQLLSSMCDTIRHRGPDAEGLYVNGPVGLGSRRLSIIDLAGGDQPIYNEDHSIAIVFNGEIYNYPTLRDELLKVGHHFSTNGDTETIVHGYEQFGIDVLNRLNGMFAFALWDDHEKRLFIARDRTGIKPLYYTQTDEVFVFGSELKAILAYPGISRWIDPAALDAYLSFEYVPTPLSIFEGISKLPPGHFLLLEGEQLTVKRYWDIDLSLSEASSNGTHETRSEADYLAELKTVLLEAVEMEMISDV
ncbi:MAG: asparagine synthetase B, partial [Anaerolineae bacterium]|nr:asparagine synthetase B [Anaerolineae bacterium]